MPPPEPVLGGADLAAHAAYLRALARGLLGRGGEADDVVQDTFVAALEHPPRAAGGLRAWLATVARHRAIGLRRGASRRAAREADVARPESGPDASEALERLELAQRLAAEVARLREPYRTAVYLRYHEGLAPAAIAERLGVPVKTVRTRLARALEELRTRMDARHGGRDAWSALLLPLAFPRGSSASASATAASAAATITAASTGVLAMKQLAVAVSLVVAAALVWMGARSLPALFPDHASGPRERALHAAPLRIDTVPTLEAPQAQSPREALPVPDAPQAPQTGSLVVQATWTSDGAPAAGLCVDLFHLDDPLPRRMRRHALTDAAGRARFEALPPGRVRLFSSSGQTGDGEVRADEESTARLDLADDHRIEGRVVEPGGVPFAGAGIWVRVPAWEDGTHRLATSGADGRFVLRGLADWSRIGAIAPGRQPSLTFDPTELPVSPTGARLLTLELGPLGGSVAGRVLDPEGEPLAGATVVVAVHGGFLEDLPSGLRAFAPEGVHVVTGADGTFADPGGVQPGTWPVVVAAAGHPEWDGTVTVAEGQRAWIDARLERPARVRGRVLDLEGRAAPGVDVVVTTADGDERTSGPFPRLTSRTDAYGVFELNWLPAGPAELLAYALQSPRAGRARARVDAVPGETKEVELTLDLGATLRGHVVDAQGAALAGWSVHAVAQGWREAGREIRSWSVRERDTTDADGAFLIANLDRPGLPADVSVDLQVAAPGESPYPPRAERRAVHAGPADVRIVVERTEQRPGRVRGTLVTGGGAIPKDVQLTLWDAHSRVGLFVDVDPATGAFEHGVPMPGTYDLRVLRGGNTLVYSGPHEIAAGETIDVGTLEVVDGGRVRVRLAGVPIERLDELAVELLRPEAASEITLRDGDAFLSRPLAPGAWIVRLHAEPWFAPDREIEVHSGGTEDVTLEAVPAFEVGLELELADPASLWARVEIEIRDDRGRVLRRETQFPSRANEGMLHVNRLGLPLGRFHVEARTDTGMVGAGTFEIDGRGPGGTHRFTIR